MTKSFTLLKVSSSFEELKPLAVTLRMCRPDHHGFIASMVLGVTLLKFVIKTLKKYVETINSNQKEINL
jgi:hypothetical protein